MFPETPETGPQADPRRRDDLPILPPQPSPRRLPIDDRPGSRRLRLAARRRHPPSGRGRVGPTLPARSPAGHRRRPPFEPARRDQVLLTVIWLRQYPTRDVLAYTFGVSK